MNVISYWELRKKVPFEFLAVDYGLIPPESRAEKKNLLCRLFRDKTYKSKEFKFHLPTKKYPLDK